MATTFQISGEKPPTEDRRSSPRRKTDQLVYVNVGADNGGFLLDVGEGGLSCRVVGALIQGETCRPKFVLPESGASIEADCVVAWTSETRKLGGLKFVALPEETRLKIREWIKQEPLQSSIRKVATAQKMGPIQFGPTDLSALPAGAPPPKEKPTAPKVEQPTPPRVEQQIAAPIAPHVDSPTVEPVAIPIVSPAQEIRAPLSPGRPRIYVQGSAISIEPKAIESAPPAISSSIPVAHTHVVERNILSQPAEKKIVLSTPKIVAIALVLAASLVSAYHFGRVLGFDSEAARVGSAVVAPAAVTPAEAPEPEPVLPDRAVDPSVPDTNLLAPASVNASMSSDASNSAAAKPPANLAPAPGNARSAGAAAKAKPAARTAKAPAAVLNSMKPPLRGKILGADSASPAAALAEVSAPATAGFDSRSFPFGPASDSAPARPVQSGTAFPAAFQAPVLIQRVEPTYSQPAREAGIEGIVEVSAVIGKDGVPRELTVVSGDPRLAGSAMDAIRKWRYQPALSGAYVVEAPITVKLDFRIRK